MAQIALDRSAVVAVVGELIASGMPQHVAMDQEREFDGFPGSGHHALIACNAQRRTSLADEYIRRRPKALPL
jgi:hypothetical protein